MPHRHVLALIAVALLLTAGLCRAEVKVTAERNDSAAATAGFKFKSIAAPSRTDAANTARFTLVAGQRDTNGGDVDVLCDGRGPNDEDQPDACFFFAAGTEGGRIVVDLGQVTDIQQVNTYSWHANTRGPQVYKLYAGDGSAAGFDPKPGRSADPEKTGWVLVASVDTRPKEGGPGGQYGVSVAESGGAGGGVLGKYRYLLFDVARTEDTDPFGNTFFSEIDVLDGKEHTPVVAAAAGGATTAPALITVTGQYEMVFDITEMPELRPWVETRLKPVCEQWYPKIVEMLASDGYTAPRRFTVTFRKDGRGVAATGGTRVTCAGPWFSRNLEGEAVGAVVHELVHVVQQYGRVRGGNPNPGWLVEGVADYLRWFLYEPASKRPRPDPARAKYTDSYRVTAAFLNYVIEKHDKEIVKKLNVAMRTGKYTPELWKEYTGKTVDELWAAYIATLQK